MARVLRSVVIGAAVLIAVAAVTTIVTSQLQVTSIRQVAAGDAVAGDFTWQ
ncbi:hypothetical protein AB0M43_02735 [Longispora sp. NPDC051575]|uniref:hypothetical protein n=1 Tax=Longispora sp. NPDC051575 TaxID=3154943 RepID=UPI003425DEB7